MLNGLKVMALLKKWDRIIGKVAKWYKKVTHKFCIELPISVEHAYKLDGKNGNDNWHKVIDLEMSKVKVTFKTLDDGEEPPPGYQFMSIYMVYEIKLSEGFCWKVRMVAGGHLVDTPEEMH